MYLHYLAREDSNLIFVSIILYMHTMYYVGSTYIYNVPYPEHWWPAMCMSTVHYDQYVGLTIAITMSHNFPEIWNTIRVGNETTIAYINKQRRVDRRLPAREQNKRFSMASRRVRMSNLKRMYGYFRCDKCNHGWESSQVYCHHGTEQVGYHFPSRTVLHTKPLAHVFSVLSRQTNQLPALVCQS